jgi:hypothetical protein
MGLKESALSDDEVIERRNNVGGLKRGMGRYE